MMRPEGYSACVHEKRWDVRVCMGPSPTYGQGMCRNITELRGLEPAATDD